MSKQGRHNRREKEQPLRVPIKQSQKPTSIEVVPLISRQEKQNFIRKRFLILCEGETEQAYFEGIKTNVLFKDILSAVVVQVVAPTHDKKKFDPEKHLFDNSLQGMIWEAMQRKRLAKIRQTPYDAFWIVIDDDDDRKQLFDMFTNPDPKALFFKNDHFSYGQDRKKDKPIESDFDANWKKYIQMAYSCRSFEVWLLLHFERSVAIYTNSESIITHIKTYAPLFEKGLCEPDKSKQRKKTTANAYEILSNNPLETFQTSENAQAVATKMATALENTAWLKSIQKSAIEHNPNQFFGINPFTNVDALLMALLDKEAIAFGELNTEIIGQDCQIKMLFDSTKQEATIHIKTPQRLLINASNYEAFVWLQWKGNRIKPIALLTPTLNLPTPMGDSHGTSTVQFPNNLPAEMLDLHFKWKTQHLICPILE
jgi:hypothetical protein